MRIKPILNQNTPKVPRDIENHRDFVEQNEKLLVKFMKFARSRKDIVGLAAKQLSCDGERIMKRFIAVKHNYQWLLAIDPVILKKHKPVETKTEKCLTWPGKEILVKRHYTVEVAFYDLNKNYRVIEASGLQAQIFQHEIDHLNGVKEKGRII